jgi:hypothetical protein
MADPFAEPAHETRLVFQCGCVETFPLFNPPLAGDEETIARDPCQECQRKAVRATPDDALEMMAAATAEAKRWKSRRQLPQGMSRD